MNPISSKSDDEVVAEQLSSTSSGPANGIQWQLSENITVLDLSNKQISEFDENVTMPPNIVNINLSHNNLRFVPAAVLKLANIEHLDLSHNSIKQFDVTPTFCQSIKELNLSNNQLLSPPYWVWKESPSNLNKLDLSCNMNLMHALTDDDYFLKLLQYKTHVKEVIIFNCRIRNHLEILYTFPKVKALELGMSDLCNFWSNKVSSVPRDGLEQCLDIERLNLSNTQLYSIESDIDIYKNLVEINLSQNNIDSIPNKFCKLENLEVCILSNNDIFYLPDEIVELKKLVCLKLDSNKLCMLPKNLCDIPNLKILDLYDNNLYEVVDDITSLEELDLAVNFLDEPDDLRYLEQKERIRLNIANRQNGRKQEVSLPESEHSPDTSDDEEFINQMNDDVSEDHTNDHEHASSPEDWDSDEFWVPRYYQKYQPAESPWIYYIKNKMQQGNFCPMDQHTVPVFERVRYENMCNPKKVEVIEGQFDDLSSDES